MKIRAFILMVFIAGMFLETSCSLLMLLPPKKERMDIYGRIVDQYGDSVVGAKVHGNLTIRVNVLETKEKHYSTKTDSEGRFNFLGLRGAGLGIRLEKDGYNYNPQLLSSRPGDYQPDPSKPVNFNMWKLQGPEPMMHSQKFYQITPDWRIFTIDMVNHKMVEGTNVTGDLLVQIQRPAQIGPQERFDWSFTMTAIDGGFIETTNDGYLNLAPESGYQPQYKFNMTAAEEDANWKKYAYSRSVGIEKTFYFKSRSGRIYGRFHIGISPNFNDTSAIDIEYYINPSGSRNLEWNGSMQLYKSGNYLLPGGRSSTNKALFFP